MTEVFIITGKRDGERRILSVVATAEEVDAEIKHWFGDGSSYGECRVEAWGVDL